MARGDVGIGDDAALGACRPLVDQVARPRQQARPDEHVVGACAQRDLNGPAGRVACVACTSGGGFRGICDAHGTLPDGAECTCSRASSRSRNWLRAPRISLTIVSCGRSRLSTVILAVAYTG